MVMKPSSTAQMNCQTIYYYMQELELAARPVCISCKWLHLENNTDKSGDPTQTKKKIAITPSTE